MLCCISFVCVGRSGLGCSVNILERTIYWPGELIWHVVFRRPAVLALTIMMIMTEILRVDGWREVAFINLSVWMGFLRQAYRRALSCPLFKQNIHNWRSV
jgi:hypothetical protein